MSSNWRRYSACHLCLFLRRARRETRLGSETRSQKRFRDTDMTTGMARHHSGLCLDAPDPQSRPRVRPAGGAEATVPGAPRRNTEPITISVYATRMEFHTDLFYKRPRNVIIKTQVPTAACFLAAPRLLYALNLFLDL